ncbi:hypothetical protein [uncultured Draconibacterium sp.]|uniref:hypothetical protein n=1 Tax=uncultured Draconibacterium sp. TaxID=1573823 RepID=UPI0029C8E998|nr:hypothetical protein [uncultured Draconibacterium sp.]
MKAFNLESTEHNNYSCVATKQLVTNEIKSTKRVNEPELMVPGIFCGGEEIPPGGWRVPISYWQSDTYRTLDGCAFFDFGFFDTGNHIEIDIVSMPGYGNRDSSLHSTHRLPSDRDGYKICFGDESVVEKSNARYWAAAWAELSWNYIKTGEEFPNN